MRCLFFGLFCVLNSADNCYAEIIARARTSKQTRPPASQARPILPELLKRFPASAHLVESHCSPARRTIALPPARRAASSISMCSPSPRPGSGRCRRSISKLPRIRARTSPQCERSSRPSSSRNKKCPARTPRKSTSAIMGTFVGRLFRISDVLQVCKRFVPLAFLVELPLASRRRWRRRSRIVRLLASRRQGAPPRWSARAGADKPR